MLHIRIFTFLLISFLIANTAFAQNTALAQKESKLQLQTGFSAFVVNYPKDGKYFKQFNPGILLNGDIMICSVIDTTNGVTSIKNPKNPNNFAVDRVNHTEHIGAFAN